MNQAGKNPFMHKIARPSYMGNFSNFRSKRFLRGNIKKVHAPYKNSLQRKLEHFLI